MRILLQLLTLLVLCTTSASAQIVAVVLKESVSTKEYKNSMVKYRGNWVLMGEGKVGIEYDAEGKTLKYFSDQTNEMFVFDPKKPGKAAYKISKGERVPSSKKNVARIRGTDIAKVVLVDVNQTLPGIAAEYLVTEAYLDGLRKERKSLTRKSEEWLNAGHRLVAGLEAQEQWLLSFGFGSVLRKVRKEISKERKASLAGSRAKQAKADQDSVRLVDPPEELTRLSEEEYEGKHVFHSVSSNHFRIHYLVKGNGRIRQNMSDEEALDALRLAERVLDGFRGEFVDPHVAEDFEDTIPDGHLATWFFAHESVRLHDAFGKALFGTKPGGTLTDEQRVSGTSVSMGNPPRTVYFWRMTAVDFHGVICHQLGHILSEFHYGSNEGPIRQDWLAEALGNTLAVKYVGNVGASCLAIKDTGYLKSEAGKGGERTTGFGRRSMYDYIALSQAGPIRAVALKDLADMGDADLAKGWSFFYYLSENEGKAGQLFLRAAAKFSRQRTSLVERWRAKAAEIFDVDVREALAGIEARWRAHVTKELNGGK
jgi:hypothetical protein